MREIKESDWKILRQLHKTALERYCKKVLIDIQQISNNAESDHHQRYLSIYNLIRERDKEIAEVFDDLRRSRAFFTLALMKKKRLLTSEELATLSEETREAIDLLLGIA